MRGRLCLGGVLSLVIAGWLAAAPIMAAEPLNDSEALRGVEETRTVFLINLDSAKRTDSYLKAIRATHKGLMEQGVSSKMVLVFLGPVVQFITTQPEASLAAEHGESVQSIAKTSKELEELGVRMEVCGAATKRFEVDNESILPEMKVVSNGFISLIGWQSQGYVPMTF